MTRDLTDSKITPEIPGANGSMSEHSVQDSANVVRGVRAEIGREILFSQAEAALLRGDTDKFRSTGTISGLELDATEPIHLNTSTNGDAPKDIKATIASSLDPINSLELGPAAKVSIDMQVFDGDSKIQSAQEATITPLAQLNADRHDLVDIFKQTELLTGIATERDSTCLYKVADNTNILTCSGAILNALGGITAYYNKQITGNEQNMNQAVTANYYDTNGKRIGIISGQLTDDGEKIAFNLSMTRPTKDPDSPFTPR